MVSGSSGSTREWKPSPPAVTYQSALVMPWMLRVLRGDLVDEVRHQGVVDLSGAGGARIEDADVHQLGVRLRRRRHQVAQRLRALVEVEVGDDLLQQRRLHEQQIRR